MKLSLMLSILGITIAVISSAGCTSLTAQSTSANQTIDGITIPTTTVSPTPSEAGQIAAAAYVYGYPLVFMDSLKEHQTAVPAPDPARGLAPINQIMRAYQVPIAKFQFHSAAAWPITDASYIGAWLDLTKEPMVLSVPESNGRYYVMMLEDAWTNDLLPVGPRTTGDGPCNFAIVGPGWNGTLPLDVTKIQSTTNAVMIAGRTQLNGPADLPATQPSWTTLP